METRAKFFFRDSDLLARISKGDERAFKYVYDFYFPIIRLFANRILKDDEQATEIAQEVMLAFWQKGDEIRMVEDLEGFLKTLAKRRAIDALRRRILVRTTQRNIMAEWTEKSEEMEEQLAYKEVRQAVEKGLQLLPPQQQKVYRLCQQQGFKYEEAARVLNIAPGTVHSHMKCALKFMRRYLKQYLDTVVLLIVFSLS